MQAIWIYISLILTLNDGGWSMGSNAGIKSYTLDINPTQLLQQGKNPGYMAI
jgi:hypothetical protein